MYTHIQLVAENSDRRKKMKLVLNSYSNQTFSYDKENTTSQSS